MKCAGQDSFGQDVHEGDYIYFRVKSQYLPDALSLGRVTEVTPKGTIMLTAINTHNQTVEAYIKQQAEHYERIKETYKAKGEPLPKWVDDRYSSPTFKQRLQTVTSAVKIPSHVVPPMIVQLLQD